MSCRLDNILVDWNADEQVNRISVIDWEFVMMAPTFVDVGNLIQELFLLNHFEGTDLGYVTMFESFITSYRSFGIPHCVRDVLGFVGARAMWKLARWVKGPEKVTSQEDVGSCVDILLGLVMGKGYGHSRDGFEDGFKVLEGLMRKRIGPNKTA
jgi:hypothetical protein